MLGPGGAAADARTSSNVCAGGKVGAALPVEELHPNDQVRVILGALEVRRGFRISSVRSFMVGIPFDVR